MTTHRVLAYACKRLYLMYLSRCFLPPIFPHLFIFHRVSRIEISYFRSSPESMGHQSVRLQFFYKPHPHRFLASISLVLLLAFRSLPLVALSSPLYDFSISSTSVSFTRILSISQSTKRRRWNSSDQT